MKYNCEACGMYIEAGSGHSCYQPEKSEAGGLREKIAALEAERDSLQGLCDKQNETIKEQGVTIRALRDERNILERMIQGKDLLLQAYRMGGHIKTADRALKIIEEARAELRALLEEEE